MVDLSKFANKEVILTYRKYKGPLTITGILKPTTYGNYKICGWNVGQDGYKKAWGWDSIKLKKEEVW